MDVCVYVFRFSYWFSYSFPHVFLRSYSYPALVFRSKWFVLYVCLCVYQHASYCVTTVAAVLPAAAAAAAVVVWQARFASSSWIRCSIR